MDSLNSMMSLFMILIGVLALYSAFTGKGPAFKNDYPKAMKEDADNMLRKFCWIIGPTALVLGIIDYLGYSWAYIVQMIIILPTIVVYIILFRKRFKQYLKKR